MHVLHRPVVPRHLQHSAAARAYTNPPAPGWRTGGRYTGPACWPRTQPARSPACVSSRCPCAATHIVQHQPARFEAAGLQPRLGRHEHGRLCVGDGLRGHASAAPSFGVTTGSSAADVINRCSSDWASSHWLALPPLLDPAAALVTHHITSARQHRPAPPAAASGCVLGADSACPWAGTRSRCAAPAPSARIQ